MRYVNTKTGAVLDTVSVVSGGDWVAEPEKEKQKEEPKPRKPRKKGD